MYSFNSVKTQNHAKKINCSTSTTTAFLISSMPDLQRAVAPALVLAASIEMKVQIKKSVSQQQQKGRNKIKINCAPAVLLLVRALHKTRTLENLLQPMLRYSAYKIEEPNRFQMKFNKVITAPSRRKIEIS